MWPEAFVGAEGDRLARRLAGMYARGLLAFFVFMALCWAVGIESSFRNPLPFYAVLKPAFQVSTVPLAVLALMFAALATFPRAGAGTVLPRRARMAYGAAATAFLVLAGAVFVGEGAGREGGLIGLAATCWSHWRWHLLAIGLFLAALTLLYRFWRRHDWFAQELDVRTTRRFLAALIGFTILFALAIAALRDGADGIAHAYNRYTYEYIGDIGKGRTIRGLFTDYNRIHPHLSMHSKVHPPGPVALLWFLSYFVGQGAFALSVATAAFGSLAIVPLYLWVRDMFGQRTGFTACLLYSLMPGIVLFTATSGDILFMPITVATLFLFWRAVHRRSIPYAIAAGAGYAAMSLLSFSLLAVGAFFGLVGLWRLASPGNRASVLHTAAVMLAAFLSVHSLVWLWSGFDVVECFRLSKAQFDEDQRLSQLNAPRYPGWVFRFLNPLTWVYFAGIPVSILCLWRFLRHGASLRALVIIFAVTAIVLDLLYLGRGEGERSAMYLYPFLVIPAAHLLDELGRRANSVHPLGATLAFLAFQCWLTESYFYTYW